MPASNQAYTNQVLKVVVAQICQTIGFNSVQSTPMEVMIDVLHNYIREMCVLTRDYAEHYNRTEPNLEDVTLAYREMKINFNELKEYMEYVDPIPFALPVPKYPIPKESHLNFLKPGSQEVLTRPMHIPEYLPPMQPEPEEEVLNSGETSIEEVNNTIKDEMMLSPTGAGAGQQPYFRKPVDFPLPSNASDSQRRLKFDGTEGLKDTREISSVIMTTSGFISPAREGKLPDSKPPIIIPDKRPSPPPPPIVAVPLPVTNMDNKFEEKILKKKLHEVEKEKKKKVKKELFQPHVPPLYNVPQLAPAVDTLAQPSLSTSQLSASSQQKLNASQHSQQISTPFIGDAKPNVSISASPIAPRKPGRPRKSESFTPGTVIPKDKVKKPKNPDAKLIKQIKKMLAAGQLPPLPMQELLNLVKSQNIKLSSPISPGSIPTQISAPPHHQQKQGLFVTEPSPINQPSTSSLMALAQKITQPITGNNLEGKLSTESDKSKLNIFKKIPSSSKMVHHDFAPTSMIKSEMFSKVLSENSPHKIKFKQNEFDYPSTPVNMAMNKILEVNRSPVEDLTMPVTPQYMPRTPDLKEMAWNKNKDEQKKRKEKPEKKMKKIKTPPLMMPFPDLQNPMNRMSLPLMPGFPQMPQSNSLMQPPRFPFFPNLMTTGPGLIPNNPFFAGPFDTAQFGAPPFNMSSLFPGDIIQNLNKFRNQMDASSSVKDKFTEPPLMEIKQAQCNVPSLLPTSQIETTQSSIIKMTSRPESSPSIINLPKDTVAIPQYPPSSQISQPSASKNFAVEKLDEINIKKESMPTVHKTAPSTEIPTTSSTTNFDTVDLTSPEPELLGKEMEEKDIKKDKKLKKKSKKKDKTKERDRSERKKDKEERKREKKEKRREKERLALEQNKFLSSNTDSIDNSDSSLASVPKLTLKLGVSSDSRPNTPDIAKKLSIKSSLGKRKESDSDIGSSPIQLTISSHRESSPELAKISALVTHPPKQKSSHKRKHDEDALSGEDSKSSSKHMKSPSSGSEHKKHKKSTPQPSTSSLQVDASHSFKALKEEDGQKIWICPACGQVDNGTPMIGCDRCDNWYHWVCVGIQVPPDDNEDWYCRVCISRKQDTHSSEKKKKRKKNKEKGDKI